MWYDVQEQYKDESPLGTHQWGDTLGLVHIYKKIDEDGKKSVVTTSGWGKNHFMQNHRAGKFRPGRYLQRYQHGRAFGIVMRSVPLICVDIDGKNGGIATSQILQLPPTLAERSKSGNGYHLFYSVPDEWDDEYGYAMYGDFNGIVPGVDIRSTGIVYHYPGQAWNRVPVAPLSLGMTRLLTQKQAVREQSRDLIAQRATLTPDEIEDLRLELIEDLNKPLAEGKRNAWLFAWGCRAVGILENWPKILIGRGLEAGLEYDELMTLVNNVSKYGTGDR